MKNKSHTCEKFKICYLRVNNIYNHNIKYIRTDNGTEFSNKAFNEFLISHGITQQFTIPYNPEMNGRAERLNGILIVAAKSMLSDAKLSHKFWESAIDTANFIHNRLPHSSLNYSIPFEILHNTPVNYNFFRVFGCKVFFFVPTN